MRRSTLLTAAVLLASTAMPAWAFIDPPAASPNDRRMRVVPYTATDPVRLTVSPGSSVRIQFGKDEEIVQVVVSDQGTINNEPEEVVGNNVALSSAGSGGQAAAPKGPASCDLNLCRSVAGNFVYLRPLRALDLQPLFIQTKWCDAENKCEMVPYAFEILTRPGDVKVAAESAAWAVSFSYPEREAAARKAEAKKHQDAAVALWRERQTLVPPTPVTAGVSANLHYAYRGSASTQPDRAWDDGRTTFLRFNGNRRLPNVYRALPDGTESITEYASEVDTGGATLRIAGTGKKWFLRDGEEAGCLFNAGPDPEGRTASTVAPVQAVLPRPVVARKLR